MSLYNNVKNKIIKPEKFNINDHINEFKSRNIVIIVSEHISFKSSGGSYIIRDLFVSNLQNAGYEPVFIDDPKDFFTIINKYIDRIIFMFIFQSMLDIGWLFEKNLIDMYWMFDELKNKGISRYPILNDAMTFNSKVYSKMMEDKYPECSMPQSKTIFYPVWCSDKYDEYEKKIIERLNELKELGHEKAVLKKGFSGEKHGRRFVDLNNPHKYKSIIKSLEFTDDLGMYTNNGKYDEGCFRIVIIQPFNKVISQRDNEYKMWYLNKKFSGMYHLGNNKILYHYDDPFLNKLKEFGDKVVNNFVKDICKKVPRILRVDVSWVSDDKLMDKHKFNLNDKNYRLYINEIEVQPTFFFKNVIHYHDGSKNWTDKYQKQVCKIWLKQLYKHTKNDKLAKVINSIN
jgi:hypothetical protein